MSVERVPTTKAERAALNALRKSMRARQKLGLDPMPPVMELTQVSAAPKKAKGPRIEVRDMKTRKLVHTVTLQSGNRARAEKVRAGMEARMDGYFYAVMRGLERKKPESC